MSEPLFPNEQTMVARALVVGAENMSSSMEKFIDWMLAGFAAGLTYTLAQEKNSFGDFKTPIYWFFGAVLIGIAQRYIAMLISMCAAVFKEVEKLHKPENLINPYHFQAIYLTALPPLNRWAAAWVVKKLFQRDLTAFGRGFFRLAVTQIFMGGLCTLLLLITFYTFIVRLK
jgi:hypothetical protein